MTLFLYVGSIAYHTSVPALRKCMCTSRKKSLLAESAATHAPPTTPPRRTWKTCLPSPLWEVQRHESHWGRSLASTADVEDTRRTDLGMLQQLNGQYGAEHCQVAKKHLYSEVRVVLTWLQDADDSLGDLHTLHCSQCSPWACSAPRLPLVHPKKSQHKLSRRWLCAWPGRGESVTEVVPFMNFLVHSYTCCSDRHASPYWTFICQWISMGFIPSLLKKRMTERCSSLVHVASRAAIFTLLLCRRVAFLHLTTTRRPLFKPWVSLLSTYKTVELCFEFLSHL